ncbi:MAG: hypothetical protein Q8Q23_01680 [bacterium]|nr:hypothetical protein [bacterium]
MSLFDVFTKKSGDPNEPEDAGAQNGQAGGGAEKEISELNVREANLDRYQSVTGGPTMKQLSVGLWWVRNRKKIRHIVYGLIIFFCVVTVSYGAYGIGSYIYFGVAADDRIALDLSQVETHYAYLAARAAEELEFGQVYIFPAGDQSYNLAMEINNPNEDWYLTFNYSFVFGDKQTPVQPFYIMPKEKKYLTEFLYKSEQKIATAELLLSDVYWQRVSQVNFSDEENVSEFLDNHLNISARGIEASRRNNLSQVKFIISNNTAFNYWALDLYITAKQGSRLVDINKIQIQQLKSGEEREIIFIWPTNSAGAIIEVIPSVNIFDKNNYMPFDFGSGQEK